MEGQAMKNHINGFGRLGRAVHPHEIDGDYIVIIPQEQSVETPCCVVEREMPKMKYISSVSRNRHERRKQASLNRKSTKRKQL